MLNLAHWLRVLRLSRLDRLAHRAGIRRACFHLTARLSPEILQAISNGEIATLNQVDWKEVAEDFKLADASPRLKGDVLRYVARNYLGSALRTKPVPS